MSPVILRNFCRDPLKKKIWDVVERPDSQLDADIYFWFFTQDSGVNEAVTQK